MIPEPSPMHEDEAFLRAIIEAPDDDTPRLIYADWLEERGVPRAEFIRIQCALANLPVRDPDKAALRIRARLCHGSQELLAQHEDEWLRPLALLSRRLRFGWTCGFRRGFVESIRLFNAENRRYNFPRLTGSQFEDLFQLAPIRELSCNITLDSLERLLGLPQTARLRSLNLSASDIGDVGAHLLASSPSLAGLRALTLERCGIGSVGADELFTSIYLIDLELLDLTGNPIDATRRSILRTPFGAVVRL
jgi:uncharacterized protein (TIGR02996 family)